MKIISSTREHLSEISTLNKIDDYGNPDDFLERCIRSGTVEVAVQDERVIGFSLYQIMWGNTMFLALVKVHPDFQGSGIGTDLVKSFEENIKQEGFTTYLSSTTQDNILSQKFHEKLGFKYIGTLDMPHGKEMFYRKEI